MDPRDTLPTHSVINQPPERGDRNLWVQDEVLQCHAVGADMARLRAYGQALGSQDMARAARDANRHGPELRLFDTGGRRLDEVHFHPAYHRFLDLGLSAGYAAGPWSGGNHVSHAAMVYLHSQVEPGTCCPMTMSYAAIPALSGQAGMEDWVAKLERVHLNWFHTLRRRRSCSIRPV